VGSLLGVLVALTGVTGQQMGDISALAFPLHAGVFAGLAILFRTTTLSPS